MKPPLSHAIMLRHVKEAIRSPWQGRYAAITRAGDSLLLHISPSCLHSVNQLSKRTKLGQAVLSQTRQEAH